MKRTSMLAVVLTGAFALTGAAHGQPHANTQRHSGPGSHGPMNFSFGMHQGRLGAQVTSMTSSLRRHFGAPANAGLLVSRVMKGSVAAKAGLKVGDVIVKVAGKDVAQPWDVMTALAGKSKGDKVTVHVIRNKRPTSLHATITGHGWGGTSLHALGQQFGQQFGKSFKLGPNFGTQFGKNFSKQFGKNFSKQFGKNFGKTWRKTFGKDFDIIIKQLQNGHVDLSALRNWAATGKGSLAKNLRETMKRVLELEKSLKQLQKIK